MAVQPRYLDHRGGLIVAVLLDIVAPLVYCTVRLGRLGDQCQEITQKADELTSRRLLQRLDTRGIE
jgi:hypothetical protein